MRCAALAAELSRRGAYVRFVCRRLEGDLIAMVERSGFDVSTLVGAEPDDDIVDAEQICGALGGALAFDWIVVDHYRLGKAWENRVRQVAHRILAIDDSFDRDHSCELLLNQNLVRGPPVEDDAMLIGPRFALLREEFASRRRQGTMVRPLQDVQNILICFGGADPANHTAAAIEALTSTRAAIARVEVAIGASHRARDALVARCGELGFAVLDPAGCLADAMAMADLAIGAGGTMSWERACLGTPTLAFGIAVNQAKVLEALIAGGFAVGIPHMPEPDSAMMGKWIDLCLSSPSMLRGLGTRSAALTDGAGAARVADRLCPWPVTFRLATPADSPALLAWRNDPQVRSMAFSTDAIEPAEHQRWLTQTLKDPRKVLLVAEHEGTPVGVVRFDLANDVATISVYRVPDGATPRRGLVTRAADWLATHRPEVRRIVAEVRAGNVASLAAFRSAGFRPVCEQLVLELHRHE